MLIGSRSIPSMIKYMGSKSEIIAPILKSINRGYQEGQTVCDLFSGSCTLAGALRKNNIPYVSNDIQAYTSVLSNAYTAHYRWNEYPPVGNWIEAVRRCMEDWKTEFPSYFDRFSYERTFTLVSFTQVEEAQRSLIDDQEFERSLKNSRFPCIREYHLFTRYYAGTYWNFAQCVWIDCCRYVIDTQCGDKSLADALLACLMFAMAYNSQSTGHYAQFRKAQTERSMEDILIYRRKQFEPFFERKYEEMRRVLKGNKIHCTSTTKDFLACLDNLPDRSLVYADPPYCFVHYSRFYHILETLVRYDYPTVQYDGRYREGRHQSPFCIATQVEGAFNEMFVRLRNKQCSLVLSYSKSENTMIPLDRLIFNAHRIFNQMEPANAEKALRRLNSRISAMLVRQAENNRHRSLAVSRLLSDGRETAYTVTLRLLPYQHSTMGRTQIKEIKVYEAILEIFPH